jgi:site-specific recombinase XerC
MLGHGQEHPCLVKDYSGGAVRLQLNGFEIPDDFALLFAPNEPLRHACGYKLANDGHDTRAIQAYLGHRNIQNTTRYTAFAPQRGSRSSFAIDRRGPL